jgi:hypothetical protein
MRAVIALPAPNSKEYRILTFFFFLWERKAEKEAKLPANRDVAITISAML